MHVLSFINNLPNTAELLKMRNRNMKKGYDAKKETYGMTEVKHTNLSTNYFNGMRFKVDIGLN